MTIEKILNLTSFHTLFYLCNLSNCRLFIPNGYSLIKRMQSSLKKLIVQNVTVIIVE